ncbi:phage tail fiber protein [Providencia rettgeri]|uniref:phage tail fiber protein n=1 Tax=Providencia rettgeri TaxID=587 RepID=UPI0035235A29
MYNTGTVTTTANSTKLVGTGTKWLNNINRVSAEQAIQIQIGTTVHNNSIQSIQSDTELTLNFPLPTAVTGAKYVILTTMVHSVSDAMNKIVSMNGANVQFSDILMRWMTEQGIITVTLPDQTTQQLRTTKEMDKQLDGKFDKAGGETSGNVTVKGLLTAIDSNSKAIQVTPAAIRTKTGTVWIDHVIPGSGGTFMQVGDYGIGSEKEMKLGASKGSCFISYVNEATGAVPDGFPSNGAGLQSVYAANRRAQWYMTAAGDFLIRWTNSEGADKSKEWSKVYTTANTTKDSNGNLKAASPIILVFADHIELNEEAEGVTLKKLHTGIYQLHGVLGLHSDASWGGINGGITIPCGINQLPLVYALYDVLEKGKPHPFDGRIVETDEDGDIVLYTSYRQHDLPQNIQYERFKLYPEFLRDATEGEESIPGFDGKVELTPGEPCDIPVGHWVDVRVNMPSNSIYNQKQAEAERLAKIEAERLAQEEAKRAVEEAERAEQEAVERKQYGLDDNSVLL